MLTAAVTFMIEEADSLFDLPAQLRRDIETHMANRKANRAETPKKMPTLDNGRPQSPVVNTIFSFVDREVFSPDLGAFEHHLPVYLRLM